MTSPDRFSYLIAEEMLQEFKEVVETLSDKFLRKMEYLVSDVTRYMRKGNSKYHERIPLSKGN